MTSFNSYFFIFEWSALGEGGALPLRKKEVFGNPMNFKIRTDNHGKEH